jgi:hypothetical protein
MDYVKSNIFIIFRYILTIHLLRSLSPEVKRPGREADHSPPTSAEVQTEVKYLGLYLDQKLTWQKYVKTKRQKLLLKQRETSWLLGRKSKFPQKTHFYYIRA